MCKKLTHDNFEGLTRFRWSLITQRDVSSWDKKDGVSDNDNFLFEIFLHVRKQTLEHMPTSLRRENQSRTEAASQQIRNFEARNYLTLETIICQHLLVCQARK